MDILDATSVMQFHLQPDMSKAKYTRSVHRRSQSTYSTYKPIVCEGEENEKIMTKKTRTSPRRTRSAPMKLELHWQATIENLYPPSPICRWSSLPPQETNTAMSAINSSSRRRSLQSISMVPPRMPSRRSGRAEELRAALPPKVPLRKPGDALMESRALPPYMPKRKLEDSSDHLSLVSMMNRDPSDDENDDSYGDDDPLYLELGRIAPTNRGSIKANLERVLGEVLERLEDDFE